MKRCKSDRIEGAVRQIAVRLVTELILDAAVVAPRLGLSPERFMALWRRGIIRQRVEHGIGEDEGRFRVTLRYLAARVELIVDAEGTVLSSR
jgi:hypothetical protein